MSGRLAYINMLLGQSHKNVCIPSVCVWLVWLGGVTSGSELHEAAASGDIFKIKELVKVGASLEAKADLGRTPLHLAATMGHAETINALMLSFFFRRRRRPYIILYIHMCVYIYIESLYIMYIYNIIYIYIYV